MTEGTAESHHDGHHDDDGDFPFYSIPVQRQRWGDLQFKPHTNWGDTFFDLFYVAAYVPLNLGFVVLSRTHISSFLELTI